MKKIILSILVIFTIGIAVLLSFASEEELNTIACIDEAEYSPQTAMNAIDILDAEMRPNENAWHPFAAALRGYMEGYDGVVRAYLVTLDTDGAIGVLTSRTPTRVLFHYDFDYGYHEYTYEPSKTLFYMQDDGLFQIDVSNRLFVSGKYNRLMERIHTHTHVVELIYRLEYGRLETSTRLEYFSDEYLLYLFDDDDIVAESIAGRDADAKYVREKYGLVALLPPNFGHMRNTQDQTAQILAMTIDCMPSLNATATIVRVDQISVIISDIAVEFATGEPVFVDGNVLAPAHELFDLLGFLVTWRPQAQQFRLLGNAGCIVVVLNSEFFIRNYYGNRSYHALDVPAQVIGGIIMTPICVILENAGYDVQWDEVAQTVTITSSN